MLEKFNELGKKYGKLTVIERAGNYKDGSAMWYCICDCGSGLKIKVRASSLRLGHTISCGCYVIEKAIKVHTNKIVSEETRKKMAVANRIVDRTKTMSNIGKKYPERGSAKRGSLVVKKVNSIIQCAKTRGWEFSITKEFAADLVANPCFYCGKESNLIGYKESSGIDRIDNSKGYIDENCVSCCFYCNACKNNNTLDEFEKRIIRMYNLLKKRKSLYNVEKCD